MPNAFENKTEKEIRDTKALEAFHEEWIQKDKDRMAQHQRLNSDMDKTYRQMGGDGEEDIYMSDGIYMRPDGSTYQR